MGYKKDLGESVMYISTGKTATGYRGKGIKRKKSDIVENVIERIL